MSKIKRNKITLAVSIIVIILTLLLLSNVVKAIVGLKEIKNTKQLSKFIVEDVQGFVYDATPGQIFALNARNDGKGLSYDGNEVYYKSTICIFHRQSTVGYSYRILTNLVDIEAPGDVIVYQYESVEKVSSGKEGTKTEDGNKITEIVVIKEDGKEQKYKVTYTKTVLDLTDEERENFEKMAFLMNKAMTYNIEPSDKILNSNSEAHIDWYWKNYIKDSIKEDGVLDPHFDIDTYSSKDQPSYIPKQEKEASEAATEILEVTLTKGETTPQVYYGDNGKAYIGPLKVNYTGGTTEIKVQGKSGEITANWTTRNQDETFNKEITGNITSDQIFYAVVDASEIEGIDNVNVKVYLNYTKGYKSRFVLANNKLAAGQNLMFFAGNKDSEAGKQEVQWDVENIKPKYGDLIIHKKGDNNTNLQGVEFTIWKAVSENTGYLRLSQNSTFVEKVNKEIDINDYQVEYVGINEIDKATKFVTNSDGKIIIKNLEYSKGSINYSYYVGEETNNNYGYKGMSMTVEDVTIKGGTIEEVQEDGDIEFTIGKEDTEILLTIQNNPELAPLEIIKVGGDGKTTLAGVKFKIEIGTGTYLQLQNSNGAVESVTGTVTINKDNIAQGSEYAVAYITDKELATEFVTDENGKIIINNLEVNASRTQKYTYTAHEISNPNFGYGSNANISLKQTIKELKLNEPNQIKITNTQDLGNVKLTKYDEENQNIVLENVGFILEVSSQDTASYIALYDKNGNALESLKGTATINKDNKATDTEYKLGYVLNKEDATIFVTGENGVIVINNLEVYALNKEKYSYKFIEVTNSNSGYVAESQELGNITIESGKTTEKELGNKQKYIDLSGYVWIENPQGKSNGYDNVYTNNNDSRDKVLKDLYTTGSEGLAWNANAEIPVKIQLQDKQGNVIKIQPNEFGADGKYTFKQLEIEKLSEYQVVFVYEGFYYSTVVPDLEGDELITSKVKEVQAERDALNSKFGTVEAEGKVISTNGEENTVTYTKQGNTSKLKTINFDTWVAANTNETDINFKTKYDELKQNATDIVEKIDNINMGLVIREQPDLSIVNDTDSVEINVNGHKYSYVYATRNQHTVKTEQDLMGVKFENEVYLAQRYTRTIYASDIEAAVNGKAELSVSIIYKMTIVNESRTLAIAPKEITNYFDSRYAIEKDENGNHMIYSSSGAQVKVNESRIKDYEKDPVYKVAQIEYAGQIAAGEQDSIYVRFSVSQDAIKDLLSKQSTYHNAVEINKYASYYTAKTGTIQYTDEAGNIQDIEYTTDRSSAGSIYAGIDEDSAPGNIEINLIDHINDEGGTPILDITKYEDDEDSAPSLILEAGEERAISGTVWEDKDAREGSERVGDGIYDTANEKTIANVVVELWEVQKDSNGNITGAFKANYSDGNPATTKTGEDGKYTFGYNYIDEETGKTKYVGILPGTYFIKYVYDNESYVEVPENNINALEYKSTIVNFTVNETKVNGDINILKHDSGDKWYLVEEKDAENNVIRHSDAVDNMSTRAELTGNTGTINNATYQSVIESEMDAKTPIMEIGVEFTTENVANGTLNFINRLEKVDFGIIERPRVSYEIIKQIKELEIAAQTGTNIVPKGNPHTDSMQYVRALKEQNSVGQVSVELDTSLLQGATLKLGYKISVKNTSELDYEGDDYYYYGTNPGESVAINLEKVVDYLDETIKIDPEKQTENSAWTTYTTDQLETAGLASGEVLTQLGTENYTILVTDQFKDLQIGAEPKSVMLYVSKQLASGEELNVYNDTEIIEISGGRTITGSIPGNYVPTHEGTQYFGRHHESDDDRETLVILDPTGATINYMAYIIAIGATLAILVAGIIITKKVMKKQ